MSITQRLAVTESKMHLWSTRSDVDCTTFILANQVRVVGDRFVSRFDECYEERGVAESRDVDVEMLTTKESDKL